MRSLVVIAALLLAGCGIGPAPSSPAPSASPVPPPTVALSPMQAPPPTPVTPEGSDQPTGSGVTCAPGDLVATAGWQGATGQMAGMLTLTNTGRQACTVNGSPRLVQLRSGTTILEPITYEAGSGPGPGSEPPMAGPVLLRPGDRAGAFLLWSNWCAVMIPVVSALVVTLPDGAGPIVASPAGPGMGLGGTPRCDNGAAGSTFAAYAFVPVTPDLPD